MPLRPMFALLALAAALALAACGSDSTTTEATQAAEEEQTTPAQARAEIGKVRAALDQAVAAVRKGDAKAAEEAVSEGYLQHFEKVEGPLGDIDHDLNEKLEDTIRETLRERIQEGASAGEVAGLVEKIQADLATAERKLR